VKIKVLGAFGSAGPGQRPAAFLVDDRVLVDAGTVGEALTLSEQLQIEHALLSHAHLDHVVGLAFLTDALGVASRRHPLTAVGIEPVLTALRAHIFNDILWPDFTAIPSPADPVLRFRVLPEEAESRVGDLWVTPVSVHHAVPTAGFIIHDGETGFLYSGDTGPTDRIWRLAREMRGLKALVVETAFPDRLEPLARAAGHLTPSMLRRELDKMPPDLPVWVFHVKPQLHEETVEELARIDPARLHVVEQGKTYTL
jgi:cAMP phosphodiesterase